MPDISPNVVILTREELFQREDRAFLRGVERGKFEASTPDARVARNCRYWANGVCERCGAQHQGCEVNADFKCPHWSAR